MGAPLDSPFLSYPFFPDANYFKAEKHLYLEINVWSLRSDLERHWFRTGGQASMSGFFLCPETAN